ncbi:MAG TPA: DNA polymerase III subunit gamma/tau [Patescibacteria group bacterium]|nr:DNA polymerase III subunit gamma/tau [Patescibacteria group bacterium]
MSLYRKYRPQKFSEIIGQEYVVKTVLGAVTSNQIGHAYIFAGIRGTGKTTIARIFAKSINCLDAQNGEPCDKCKICQEVNGGSFLDLIEIDAASNRGIDDIRDLREKVKFSPNMGKYKVYIIDEAHMLTEPAFNALLKTLEEPPAHAVFILATTEIHKIPATILSRCQRLDFHKIENGKLIEGIKKIAEKEGIKIDEKSLKKIVAISEGSVRDALSYLDQVSSFSSGGEITIDLIENILGYSREENMIKILDLIKSGNIQSIIEFINMIEEEGRDIENFVKDFIKFLRNILIAKIDKNGFNVFIDEKKVSDIAAEVSFSFVLELIESMNRVLKGGKFSFIPQLPLELEMVRFLKGGESVNTQKENEVREDRSEIKRVQSIVEEELIDVEDFVAEKDISQNIKSENSAWKLFLDNVKKTKMILYMALQGCSMEEDGSTIRLLVCNPFYFDRISERGNSEILNKIAQETFGVDKKIAIIRSDKKTETKQDLISEALSVFGGEIIE